MPTLKPDRQQLEGNLLTKLGGLVGAKCISAWMHTLDARAMFYDRNVDPALGVGDQRIYIFWHEYILLPLSWRGHCHVTMLLSQHRDADILARAAHHMGFGCVRGSTYGGAARAIRELRQRSQRQHLTLTPDGPRGPRRCLAAGPIYLASRLQLPLVAIGFGYDRPIRVNSWDRFAVPRPWSRARAVIGPSILLPPRLDRPGLEHCRNRVERLLNGLTTEAENWAASGSRGTNEIAMTPAIAPPLPAPVFGSQFQRAVQFSRAA